MSRFTYVGLCIIAIFLLLLGYSYWTGTWEYIAPWVFFVGCLILLVRLLFVVLKLLFRAGKWAVKLGPLRARAREYFAWITECKKWLVRRGASTPGRTPVPIVHVKQPEPTALPAASAHYNNPTIPELPVGQNNAHDATPVAVKSAEFSSGEMVGKAVFGLIVMTLGAMYGAGAYQFFDSAFSRRLAGVSGVMLYAFLAGVPLCIGIWTGYMARRRRDLGVADAGTLSVLSICLFVFTAGALLREGMVCIWMATPLFLIVGLIGVILGGLLSLFGGTKGPKLLSVTLLLPFIAGGLENEIASPTAHQQAIQSIHILAAPSTVWRHINLPLNIQPNELQSGFAFRMGVPYPMEARTVDARVGGVRKSTWERGIQFDEVITAWEPEKHIAWEYKFGAESFPSGSLDDHVVIGGRYFNLGKTAYTLTPEAGGTRLTVEVQTSVTTNFNWYAGLWARFLVDDAAQTILKFYKARSESAFSHVRAAGPYQ
jgi:uncharacterized protein YndB with AHSA1/START domain